MLALSFVPLQISLQLVACSQRRCYWLLESEDDIVLVHYLNIAQRQQAGRRVLPEDVRSHPKSQPKSCEDNDSSCQSQCSQDCSQSSDRDPQAQPQALAQAQPQAQPQAQAQAEAVPLTAAQAQEVSPASADAADSSMLGPHSSEALIQLIPSFSSMDMLFSAGDSKFSLDGKVNGDDALRSNAAVQDLLRSWEEDNPAVDLPFLQNAQDSWQVRYLHAFPKNLLFEGASNFVRSACCHIRIQGYACNIICSMHVARCMLYSLCLLAIASELPTNLTCWHIKCVRSKSY